MLTIVALFGVLIILVCAYGSANPGALLKLVDRFASRSGFLFAILIRVVLGLAAYLAAPDSLSPVFLQIVAGIALAAAIGLAVMGLARYRRLIGWVSNLGSAMIHVALVFGLLFGAALVWVSGAI